MQIYSQLPGGNHINTKQKIALTVGGIISILLAAIVGTTVAIPEIEHGSDILGWIAVVLAVIMLSSGWAFIHIVLHPEEYEDSETD